MSDERAHAPVHLVMRRSKSSREEKKKEPKKIKGPVSGLQQEIGSTGGGFAESKQTGIGSRLDSSLAIFSRRPSPFHRRSASLHSKLVSECHRSPVKTKMSFLNFFFFLAAKGSSAETVAVRVMLVRDKREAICLCHSESDDSQISNHPSRRPPTGSIFFFFNCSSILNGLCDDSASSVVKEAKEMRDVSSDWCQILLEARPWFVTRSWC